VKTLALIRWCCWNRFFHMLKTLFQICIIFIHLTYTQGQSVYNKQSPNLSRIDQTYVYHTNGNLWMGWDSYGNTGDQTCSGIIPGCFTGSVHHYTVGLIGRRSINYGRFCSVNYNYRIRPF